jgi:hypothetical protein
MIPENFEGLPPVRGGPQGTAIALARDCNIPSQQNPAAAQEPVDRRTSTSGLSVPIRDVRIRLARNDIFDALGPVSRNAECALYCLELDDDEGLELHLRRVVDSVRKAAGKHRELRVLLLEPGRGARR